MIEYLPRYILRSILREKRPHPEKLRRSKLILYHTVPERDDEEKTRASRLLCKVHDVQ